MIQLISISSSDNRTWLILHKKIYLKFKHQDHFWKKKYQIAIPSLASRFTCMCSTQMHTKKKKVLTLRFFEHQDFSWKQNWFSRIRARCTKLEISNKIITSSWDFVIIEPKKKKKRQTRREHCIITISYTYNVILSWVITFLNRQYLINQKV